MAAQYWLCCGQRMWTKCTGNDNQKLTSIEVKKGIVHFVETKFESQLLMWSEKVKHGHKVP